MRYQSQRVAYAYFVVAMLLYGLQVAFGLLAAAKYLGPDPLLHLLPFDRAKEIHTNLLLVWVITGFMGAAYWVVPEESRTELYSVRLAYLQRNHILARRHRRANLSTPPATAAESADALRRHPIESRLLRTLHCPHHFAALVRNRHCYRLRRILIQVVVDQQPVELAE